MKEQSKAKQEGTRQNNKTWGNNKAQSETTRHDDPPRHKAKQ
jgi:hypothetical protein